MDGNTELLLAMIVAGLAGLLALAALIGIAVAVHPPLLERLRRLGDRRFSMRRATGPLDRPRRIDSWFYRHHRVYGVAVAALAVFLLYFLVFGRAAEGWLAGFSPGERVVAQMLAEAATLVLWIMAVFALMIGTVVFVRPSALKALEQRANRWVTARRHTRGLSTSYHGADEWMARRPRLWGVVVGVLAAVCLVALVIQWRSITAGG